MRLYDFSLIAHLGHKLLDQICVITISKATQRLFNLIGLHKSNPLFPPSLNISLLRTTLASPRLFISKLLDKNYFTSSIILTSLQNVNILSTYKKGHTFAPVKLVMDTFINFIYNKFSQSQNFIEFLMCFGACFKPNNYFKHLFLFTI
jgi:hypothetical protein